MPLPIQRLRCAESLALAAEDKAVFGRYLESRGLTPDIWDFFSNLASLSTPEESFFYVKVFDADELIGLAVISRVEHYNPYYALHSRLRRFGILKTILTVSRLFGRNVMYCAMSEILRASLDGPCFFIDPVYRTRVQESIASRLCSKPDASYVVVMDASQDRHVYESTGFAAFPYCSNAWIDTTNYKSLDACSTQHSRTRKKIARFRRKPDVAVEIHAGRVAEGDLEAIRNSLACSATNTRTVIPFEHFIDTRVLATEAFSLDSYLHVLIRIGGTLVGSTTFKKCGRHLGGIFGGFDRNYTYDTPIYELVMVSVLEYALVNGFERIHFGIVNNYTKARLTDSYESLDFHFYSRIWLYRKFQRWFSPIWTPHELHQLERKALHGGKFRMSMRRRSTQAVPRADSLLTTDPLRHARPNPRKGPWDARQDREREEENQR
jgi:hypothetical protein